MIFSQPIAQVPDPTDVIDSAVSHGWEAGMLAVLIIACMSAIVYMVKRQNDSSKEERNQAQEREKRMAARIDTLEGKIHSVQQTYTEQLMQIVKEVSKVMSENRAAMEDMRQSLQAMADGLNKVDNDLHDLCQLMQVCPCLLVGQHRGKYKLVDRDGKEVNISEIRADLDEQSS